MAVSILHPWAARAATLRNAWRLAYQLPIATPVLGPAMLRDGRALRAALGRLVTPRAAAVYADVLRAPERAAASAALYRAFLLRELPAIAAGRYARARIEVPVKLLFPRGDGAQAVSQLPGLEARTPIARRRGRRRQPLPAGPATGRGRGPRARVVRLITWNVARRARSLVAQAAAVGGREPDLLALQEVTARTWPLWEAACATLGLPPRALLARRGRPGARAGRAAAPRRAARLARPARAGRPARRAVAGIRARRADRRDRGARRARPQRGQRPDQAADARRAPRRARHAHRAGGRMRRLEHAAARAAGRHRLVVRPRREGTAAGGARGLLGRGGTGRRARPARPRVRRRVPRAARLRVARAELGVAPRRGLAARPRRLLGGPHAGRRGLSPRLAAGGPQRPLRARGRTARGTQVLRRNGR